MDDDQELKTAYKTSAAVYAAFMLSLVPYVIVFMVLKTRFSGFPLMEEGIEFPWLRYAFFALGLLQVFLIKFIRETLTTRVMRVDRKILSLHLQKMSLISAALCEIPALLGLVLFLLNGNAGDFYVLLIISVVLFVMYFPRWNNWEEWVRSKTSH